MKGTVENGADCAWRDVAVLLDVAKVVTNPSHRDAILRAALSYAADATEAVAVLEGGGSKGDFYAKANRVLGDDATKQGEVWKKVTAAREARNTLVHSSGRFQQDTLDGISQGAEEHVESLLQGSRELYLGRGHAVPDWLQEVGDKIHRGDGQVIRADLVTTAANLAAIRGAAQKVDESQRRNLIMYPKVGEPYTSHVLAANEDFRPKLREEIEGSNKPLARWEYVDADGTVIESDSIENHRGRS